MAVVENREDRDVIVALKNGITKGVSSQNQLIDDCEMIKVDKVIAMLNVPCSYMRQCTRVSDIPCLSQGIFNNTWKLSDKTWVACESWGDQDGILILVGCPNYWMVGTGRLNPLQEVSGPAKI